MHLKLAWVKSAKETTYRWGIYPYLREFIDDVVRTSTAGKLRDDFAVPGTPELFRQVRLGLGQDTEGTKIRVKRGSYSGAHALLCPHKSYAVAGMEDDRIPDQILWVGERFVENAQRVTGRCLSTKGNRGGLHRHTGSLCGTIALHKLNRLNEPDDHLHVEIPDLTQEEGVLGFYAINRVHFRHAMGHLRRLAACDLVYATRRLGYECDGFPVPRLSGVRDDLCGEFSNRSKEIRTVAGKRKLSPRTKDYYKILDHITLTTRSEKSLISRAEFCASFQARTGAARLDELRTLVECARQGVALVPPDATDREIAGITAAVLERVVLAECPFVDRLALAVAVCRAIDFRAFSTRVLEVTEKFVPAGPDDIMPTKIDLARSTKLPTPSARQRKIVKALDPEIISSLAWPVPTIEPKVMPEPMTIGIGGLAAVLTEAGKGKPHQVCLTDATPELVERLTGAIREAGARDGSVDLAGQVKAKMMRVNAAGVGAQCYFGSVAEGDLVRVRAATKGFACASEWVVASLDPEISVIAPGANEGDSVARTLTEKVKWQQEQAITATIACGDRISPLRKHDVLVGKREEPRTVHPSRAYVVTDVDLKTVHIHGVGRVPLGELEEWCHSWVVRPDQRITGVALTLDATVALDLLEGLPAVWQGGTIEAAPLLTLPALLPQAPAIAAETVKIEPRRPVPAPPEHGPETTPLAEEDEEVARLSREELLDRVERVQDPEPESPSMDR